MKLFYRKSGIGPYLIILHGLYGSSDNWITISRKLSDIYTVILPDQRNHILIVKFITIAHYLEDILNDRRMKLNLSLPTMGVKPP